MCEHVPVCPTSADAAGPHARLVADRLDQGWCLLCNGVVVFDDGYYLTPDRVVGVLESVGSRG